MVPGFGRSQTRLGFTSPGRVCAVCHPQPVATYHAEAMIGEPLCGELDGPDDQVVPIAELHRPDGRHFNCVRCHKVLSGGHRHVPPPPDWDSGSP